MPDARVQAAIDHWAPRFVQAGVDYSDFIATTSRVDTWDQWLDAWCENGDMHAALAGEARSRISAGEAWARATVAYHFGKFVWVVDPERSRAAADRAVARLEAWPDEAPTSPAAAAREPSVVFEHARLREGLWLERLVRIKTYGQKEIFNGIELDFTKEVTDFKRFTSLAGDDDRVGPPKP